VAARQDPLDALRRTNRRLRNRIDELEQAIARLRRHVNELQQSADTALYLTDPHGVVRLLGASDEFKNLIRHLVEHMRAGKSATDLGIDDADALKRQMARARLYRDDLTKEGRVRQVEHALRIGAIDKGKAADYRKRHALDDVAADAREPVVEAKHKKKKRRRG